MDTAPSTSPELPPAPKILASESQDVHIVVEAIYEDGVIKPLVPLDLTAGTPITLQIATRVPAPHIPPEAPLAAPHEHVPGSVLPTAPVPGVTEPHIQLPRFGNWMQAGVPWSSLRAEFTRADMLLLGFGLLSWAVGDLYTTLDVNAPFPSIPEPCCSRTSFVSGRSAVEPVN